jgi:hypothetical protein
MTQSSSLPEIGRRLVEAAADRGLTIRLMGGVAIWLHATEEAREALGRSYPDLDLVAHEPQSRAVRDFLEEQGYEGEKLFNAIHGAQRLLYRHTEAGYQIDVFLDNFNMSHKLDLGKRLETEPITLPAAELLLTKLQIAEINRKDVGDVVMLLWSHRLGSNDGPGELNMDYVAKVCASDWGLFTTLTDNLTKARELLPEVLGDNSTASGTADQIKTALARLDEHPKSLGWKARAKVGRRVRWYEVPEEVNR